MPIPGDLSHPALPDPDPVPPVQRGQAAAAVARPPRSDSRRVLALSGSNASERAPPAVDAKLETSPVRAPLPVSDPAAIAKLQQRGHRTSQLVTLPQTSPFVRSPSSSSPEPLPSSVLVVRRPRAGYSQYPRATTRIRSRLREPKPDLPILPRRPVPARPTQTLTAHHPSVLASCLPSSSTPRRLASWPRDPRRARNSYSTHSHAPPRRSDVGARAVSCTPTAPARPSEPREY